MTDQPRVVVDTSALIDGADVDHPTWRDVYTYIQGAYEVRAPELLSSEAGNIVHRKHPEVFGEDRPERSRVLETLLSGVETVSLGGIDLEHAGEVCERFDLTFYDAEFLTLASKASADILLTHDEALLEAGKDMLGEDCCMTLDEAGSRIADRDLGSP